MDCVFCKILNKEIPGEILYEDNQVFIIKDIKPSAPLHFLVIPKLHIESIADLKGENHEIVSAMIYAAKDFAKSKNIKGYKLVFNVGRDGGQIIDHLHLHILAGWELNKIKTPDPKLDK